MRPKSGTHLLPTCPPFGRIMRPIKLPGSSEQLTKLIMHEALGDVVASGLKYIRRALLSSVGSNPLFSVRLDVSKCACIR